MKEKISYVIPCYNSEKFIKNTVEDLILTIEKDLSQYDYEIILVNDCSKDKTFMQIKELALNNEKIKAIDLAKNFGQHNALMAGFRRSTGDIVLAMDDDGQTLPSQIKKIINALDDETDVVYAKYSHKKHSWFRNLGTKINDYMAVKIIKKPKDLYVSSFFAMKKYIKDEIMTYKNPYPYIIGLVLRTTNRIKNVEVVHSERKVGKSNYNLKKLVSLLMNGFTNFSVTPLRVALFFAIVFILIAALLAIIFVINKINNPLVPQGWTSIIILNLIIGAVVTFILGLIGEYVGRIYMAINNNPQYVIREIVDESDKK